MSFEFILPFLRPIESLLLDESVSEIMGNPDASWWYERDGIMLQKKTISFDTSKLHTGLENEARRRQPTPRRTAPGREPVGGSRPSGSALYTSAHHQEIHQRHYAITPSMT